MILPNVSCVSVARRGLLIEGPPGSGKSSLALALIDRGAQLIGDDGVTLERREGRLWASPPPNIEGLIEARNVGLIRLTTGSAPLAMVVRLDPAAPRLVEKPRSIELAGASVPLISLWPDSPILSLRAEHALALHGLT